MKKCMHILWLEGNGPECQQSFLQAGRVMVEISSSLFNDSSDYVTFKAPLTHTPHTHTHTTVYYLSVSLRKRRVREESTKSPYSF